MEERDRQRVAYLEQQQLLKNQQNEQKRMEKEAKIAEARAREEMLLADQR